MKRKLSFILAISFLMIISSLNVIQGIRTKSAISFMLDNVEAAATSESGDNKGRTCMKGERTGCTGDTTELCKGLKC